VRVIAHHEGRADQLPGRADALAVDDRRVRIRRLPDHEEDARSGRLPYRHSGCLLKPRPHADRDIDPQESVPRPEALPVDVALLAVAPVFPDDEHRVIHATGGDDRPFLHAGRIGDGDVAAYQRPVRQHLLRVDVLVCIAAHIGPDDEVAFGRRAIGHGRLSGPGRAVGDVEARAKQRAIAADALPLDARGPIRRHRPTRRGRPSYTGRDTGRDLPAGIRAQWRSCRRRACRRAAPVGRKCRGFRLTLRLSCQITR
jgi:hypothetical protein